MADNKKLTFVTNNQNNAIINNNLFLYKYKINTGDKHNEYSSNR